MSGGKEEFLVLSLSLSLSYFGRKTAFGNFSRDGGGYARVATVEKPAVPGGLERAV